MSYDPSAAGRAFASSKVFEGTADQVVASSTTETTLVPSGVGSLGFAAGSMIVGNSLEILMRGVYSSALVVPTLTARVKFAGTTIASATITNVLSLAVNRPFEARFSLVCRAIGVSGSVMPNGRVEYDNTLTLLSGWASAVLDNGGSPITVDLSGVASLDVTAQWNTASASNSIKVNQFRVSKL